MFALKNNLFAIGFIYIVLAAQIALVAGRAAVDFIRRWILLHISMRINVAFISDFLTKLMRLRKHVIQNDTIGYVWNEEPSLVVCSFGLPATMAQHVKVGQISRVFMNPEDSKEYIEVEIKEKNNSVDNQMQFIAVIPKQEGERILGNVHVYAEIVIGKKSLFQQLINPFRGLKK